MSLHVIVTGGAGYLGSIVCEHLLDSGHSVTAIDNLAYGKNSLFHLCANPRFEFVLGDARDETLMGLQIRKAEVVIPLAAVVGAPACERDPLTARSINLDSVQMLNRIRSQEQLIVYPTTNSGYGTQTGDLECDENTPLEPISLYGRTKAEAEEHLLGMRNVISFRLATVFGMSPRMRLDLLVNHFVHAAANDGYLVIFEKDFKRNFIHIRDVADCFVFAIQNAETMVGRPYNVGLDAANISKGELALKIKEHVPGFHVHFSEIGSDPDKRNYIVSNQRLREAGFEAKRSLDDGIRELLKGYRMMGPGRFHNA